MDANQTQKNAAELTSMLIHATETLATIQGLEVGFFERMSENQPITLQGLSGQMGYDIRLVERWLRFGVAAGYVSATTAGYTLTPKGMLLRNGSPMPDLLGLHHLMGYFMNVLPYSKDAYRTGVGFDSITQGVISKEFIPRVFSPLAKTLAPYFKRAGLSNGHSVLDLGCGDGAMLREIVNICAGASATGIDINPHTIELGKKINREAGLQDQIKLRVGDIMDLNKISDQAFDWVCAINVLHFIPISQRGHFLREMARISRYGVFLNLFTTSNLGVCAGDVLLSTLFTDFTGFLDDDEAEELIRKTGVHQYAFLPILRGGSRLAILLTDADAALASRIQELKAALHERQAQTNGLVVGKEPAPERGMTAPVQAENAARPGEESNPPPLSFPAGPLEPHQNQEALKIINKKLELQVAEKTENLARAYERLQRTNQSLEAANRELQAINRKQNEIDRIKSDFVSVVSHELRTPLTSIKAFAEMMLMKPGMPAKTRERLLQIIDKESDRLSRLINDVLDLTKIESGKLSWRIAQLSIQDLIETSVAVIRSLLDNKGLVVTVRIPAPLPLIFGDRDRLIQVLNNLLSNAIKFTPQGGKIEVSARSEEQPQPHITISVTDTGMGIRSEDLERIFEKFHRSGDLLAENTEGAGLGLTISRQIVEYHGGAIQAESVLGKGSTFTITLPLNKSWKREGQEDALHTIDLFEGPL